MNLEPTPRLRWVPAGVPAETNPMTLQQWWAPPMPGYLRDDSVGEWRDVPMGIEAP
jgi:hypothetical protein